MTWYGQINRTIWEIEKQLKKKPKSENLRREFLRTHFLQRYEFDRSFHVPRDDRTFLFLQEDRGPACLLLHGAQGTPAEMRELGNFLYSKGLSVYCPRLARLDTRERMVSWESWVTDAEMALLAVRRFSDETHLIGLSLGATISILLSSLHKFRSAVLLAPAIFPRLTVKERMWSAVRIATPQLFYKFAGWDGEVVKAMEYVREHSRKIHKPIMGLQARDDSRLSTKGLKFLRQIAVHQKSEVILLPFGSHVLTRGKAKEEVFQRIHQFIEQL